MLRVILYVFLVFIGPKKMYCQNLVLNPSLEIWDGGIPESWKIEVESVDFFRSNMRFVPNGISISNHSFRSKFPKMGSHGYSYFGIGREEEVSVKLKEPTQTGKKYTIAFRLQKPKLYYVNRHLNIFTVKITNELGNCQVVKIEKNKDVEKDSLGWFRVSTNFESKIKGSILSFGFYPEHFNKEPFRNKDCYYLFDEVYLGEQNDLSKSFEYRFDQNVDQISNEEVDNLLTFVNRQGIQIQNILIRGFSSIEGDEEANKALSLRRCQAIKAYLFRFNESIIIEPLGESQSTIGNEHKDRAVFVKIIYTEKQQEIKSNDNGRNDFLISELKQVLASDVLSREQIGSKNKDNNYLKLLNDLKLTDSINQAKIFLYFDSLGYPGFSKVGPEYMDVAFLVLLHSSYEKRMKYEDLLFDAISKGEATVNFMPFYIDKNLIDSGKKQKFGTQLYFDTKKNKYVAYPIEDGKKVDKRRYEYGLGKFRNYVESANKN